MRTYIQYIFCFFLFVTLVSSCQDEELSFIPSGDSAFPSSQRVEASFYGRLLDQELRPVIEAEVWIGDRMVLSDSLGDWIIPTVDVVGRQAYVKVEAEGYFSASRVLSVLPESMNLVRIMAIRKQAFTSIQSRDGGTVTLPNGSSVSFPSGGFVNEQSGAAYDGEVRVYAHAIDGRSETSQFKMPGRLESTTEDAALVSFGMIVADLETPSGEPLQLKEGAPAIIRYEQTAMDPNAPASIPLWHFDEGIGTWVKEGVSVREGNAYVGEVSHFTWWNCDYPYGLIDFCIQFVCQDSTINNLEDSQDNARFGLVATITDLLGSVRRFSFALHDSKMLCETIPANAEIEFSFVKTDGSRFIVGPFTVGSEDTFLGEHEIPCDLLDPESGVNLPTLYPPPPLVCTLNWSEAECSQPGEAFWLRVASTSATSTPTIIQREFVGLDSITISIPRNQRFIISMVSVKTGDVLGQQSFIPQARISVGTLNSATGIIDADEYSVKGSLKWCNDFLGDAYVRLLGEDGRVIDETRSSPNGRFELNTTVCDDRSVVLSIQTPAGERVFTTRLFSDLDFGELSICQSNGEYFFKGKVNGEEFEFADCNGRAGSSGWVAYADREPNPSAPFFGVVHTGKIPAAGSYQIGPDLPIRFNGFRLDDHSFTPSTHPFVGTLKVTEYGQIAAGIFTGSCVNSDGELVELEVEMRFVKP